MNFIDYAVSEDCINIYSYGEICVGCGCCSRNPNYKDRMIQQLRYYKQRLEEEYTFNEWEEESKWRKIQEKNVQSNILYYKRKIRTCKKTLRTMKG